MFREGDHRLVPVLLHLEQSLPVPVFGAFEIAAVLERDAQSRIQEPETPHVAQRLGDRFRYVAELLHPVKLPQADQVPVQLDMKIDQRLLLRPIIRQALEPLDRLFALPHRLLELAQMACLVRRGGPMAHRGLPFLGQGEVLRQHLHVLLDAIIVDLFDGTGHPGVHLSALAAQQRLVGHLLGKDVPEAPGCLGQPADLLHQLQRAQRLQGLGQPPRLGHDPLQ